MKWKDKISKLKEEGRLPEEYYALIISIVDIAINEKRIENLENLNKLFEETKKQKDLINSRNIIPYHTRLETIEEIIKIL